MNINSSTPSLSTIRPDITTNDRPDPALPTPNEDGGTLRNFVDDNTVKGNGGGDVILNRSNNRPESFDAYLSQLRNLTELMNRKILEMDTNIETTDDQRRTQRRTVQDLERTIRRALADEDFQTAGANQQELQAAKGRLTELETSIDQTDDLKERFEELVQVGEDRIIALVNNRRIILSGLKVVDVPGIDEFELIDDSRRSRRQNLDILNPPSLDR